MTMPANRVVEHLGIVEDILARHVFRVMDFALKQQEETFVNGIVVTVSSSDHARLQVMSGEKT